MSDKFIEASCTNCGERVFIDEGVKNPKCGRCWRFNDKNKERLEARKK